MASRVVQSRQSFEIEEICVKVQRLCVHFSSKPRRIQDSANRFRLDWYVLEVSGIVSATGEVERIGIMSEQLSCPSCRNKMASCAFPRTYGGEIWLDLCGSCQGIWFDAHESI